LALFKGCYQQFTSNTAFLDLEAVIQASQALSKALLPNQLITNLMELVLENAGATRGVPNPAKN
jgi:hypothetical protein